VVVAAALVAGGYLAYLKLHSTGPGGPADAKGMDSARTSATRVVGSDGCGSQNGVVFMISTAAVGQALEGEVGRLDLCSTGNVERFSGQIDWGDGTATTVDPGDFNGKDRGKLLSQPHAYSKGGTFPLFPRIRAQCFEHGQSTRTIVCGSGSIQVSEVTK
jgi:hypothetical protein